MIFRKGIMGQAYPSGTVNSTLYTVPGGREFVSSTFVACNQLGTVNYFRMAVVPSGTSLQLSNYEYYDVLMPPNETFKCTDGITMGAGDYMVVRATTTGISFGLRGQENTIQ